jgi:hypothetical protein
MPVRVLLPPDIVPVDSKVIFLNGPIQGTDDWQAKAIEILEGLGGDFVIANPRRSRFNDAFDYNGQVDWETHYRKLAENGVNLFWLARETEHDTGRAYAQTSRFEIAESMQRHIQRDAPLVVGIEEGFTGHRYIRRRFSQDVPDVAIVDTLEETCRLAVSLVGLKERH